MIILPSAVRIVLSKRPTDFRKSSDGLIGRMQDCFAHDPRIGHLFLFLNHRRDRIKILYFDRDGLAIWCKRFESASYQIPQTGGQHSVERQPAKLPTLLLGIDLRTARQRKRFQLAG